MTSVTSRPVPADESELEYLPENPLITRLWEANYDPYTQEILGGLAIGPEWRCLDVGAGGGSMSAWLAERSGAVVAVDLHTEALDALASPRLSVRRADITTCAFEPASFDLILVRAVLSVLEDPFALLEQAVRWLAPGGWLLAEDFYFMPADDTPTANARRVIEAYTAAMRAGGMDARLGRRLPSALARAGLDPVELRVRPLGPGQGESENALMRARMELQGQPLIDNGLLTAADIAEFVGSFERPAARDVTTLQFSAWGRRPA